MGRFLYTRNIYQKENKDSSIVLHGSIADIISKHVSQDKPRPIVRKNTTHLFKSNSSNLLVEHDNYSNSEIELSV